MKKTLYYILFTVIAFLAFVAFYTKTPSGHINKKDINNTLFPSVSPASSSLALKTSSPEKILSNNYHIYQTFNNCGPASLSMALSYYDIHVSQEELGQDLRPYQNPKGDNDDKSVTLSELGEKAKKYGLNYYYRPNGTVDIIKLFITYDIPVITRTITKKGEDIGHYRVVKGYNESKKQLIQDDSLQGKNLSYSYDDFNSLWKAFGYEYLILVRPEQTQVVEKILAENKEPINSWRLAAESANNQLKTNPHDYRAGFNLSVALYNTGDFQKSAAAFEMVENKIPFRTLWYNIEPILSYYELGEYNRVFEITDKILNNHNRAFSELYLLRGDIYKIQGNIELARKEYEKSVLYNKNLMPAKEALNSLLLPERRLQNATPTQ